MGKKPRPEAPVPDDLIHALEAVLARFWEPESYDYYHCASPCDPERVNHFFLDLEAIREWLDYVEDELGLG
jgi:hypothetical protein